MANPTCHKCKQSDQVVSYGRWTMVKDGPRAGEYVKRYRPNCERCNTVFFSEQARWLPWEKALENW